MNLTPEQHDELIEATQAGTESELVARWLDQARREGASLGYGRGYTDCKDGLQHRDPWRGAGSR